MIKTKTAHQTDSLTRRLHNQQYIFCCCLFACVIENNRSAHVFCRSADVSLELSGFCFPCVRGLIPELQVLPGDVHAHSLGLAGLQRHLSEVLKFFLRAVDRAFLVADIELDDFLSFASAGVSYINRHGPSIAVGCNLRLAVFESGVGQSETEGELCLHAFSVEVAVAHVYAFFVFHRLAIAGITDLSVLQRRIIILLLCKRNRQLTTRANLTGEYVGERIA